MKLLTVAIPCFNSAAYMGKCIESLLVGGEDVEIIVVNDGSTDDTSKIGHRYAERFPSIVKVIDKENGGHGRQSMQDLMRLPACTIRLWTATTGSRRALIRQYLIS